MFLEDWLAAVTRHAAGKLGRRKSVRAASKGTSGKQPLARGEIYLAESLESRVLLSVPAVFQPQQTFSTVSGSVAVVVTDLNDDGKPDLVVANQTANNVGVLLGNGNGSFQAQVTYATGGTSQRNVVVADVNGDGKPDLIVVNEGNNDVALLLGNGNGTFQAQTTFAVGSLPTFIAVADVNGDGKPDIVAGNYFGHDVSVLLGNGNGTFQAQTTFSTGGTSQPLTVAVADLNGDGKPDLIVDSRGSNAISILLGNGNGTFQNQQTFAATGIQFTVADINGDARPDLIEANTAGNAVGVMLGNGNGTFQVQQTFTTGAGSAPNSVAVADVNGDGKADLIVTNYGNANVGVLLGNGNGSFVAQQTFASGTDPRTVAVADVNDDGRSDIIVTNVGSNSVSVLLGDPQPFVQSITPGSANPIGPPDVVSSASYTVTFSKAVTGVAAADFSLALSGVTATTPVVVSGSGAVYTVTVNGIYGVGTLGLNLVNNGSIQDSLGNPLGPVGTFQAQQTFATGAGSKPYSITVADVNGDGKPDLVVVNRGGNNVGVLLGNGNGTFQAQQTFSTGAGSGPACVAVVDVNGDGKPDLIVANPGGNNVGVLLGNGNGTFQAEQTFSTGAGSKPYSITVADVNGDGKPDLIVANHKLFNVGVLLGNGNGTFQAQQTFSTGSGSYPFSVAVADVNGDGKPDLIVADEVSYNVGVLLGNGNGTFQAQQTFSTGAGSPVSVAVSDVNGDGKPDLIVANSGGNGNNVGVLLGNGNGTFQSQQTFSTGTGSYPESVAVADVNGDGKPDLIVANRIGNNVGVLLGNGNGSFAAQQTFATGSRPFSVAVADVNGDGKPDLIVADELSYNVGVLLADATGNFTGPVYTVNIPAADLSIAAAGPGTTAAGADGGVTYTLTVTNNGPDANTGFTVTDSLPANTTFVRGSSTAGALFFNQSVTYTNSTSLASGAMVTYSIVVTTPLSLATGTTLSDSVTVGTTGTLDGNSANNTSIVTTIVEPEVYFQAQQTFGTGGGSKPYSITVADVNGDGKPDLIVANYGGNNVGVLLSNGNGTFQAQQTFSTGAGSNPFSVAVADVNGDGKPDLIVANYKGYSVGVLLGNGNGTFQAEQTFSTGAGSFPRSVAVADANGDGKPDLIVANFSGNNVGVLLGNGNGSFQAEQTFSTGTGSRPLSVAVADVNGDGKPDLIVANRSGYNVGVLLGNGNGTFQAEQTFSTGAGSRPRSVAVADVNGDGKPDLIVANRSGYNVGVLLGNGNGTFQAQQTFSTGTGPFSVAVADVNGDGKPDLIVAYSSGAVGVLLGNGNGTFQAQQTFSTGAGSVPVSVAVADVNGDGKPDLIVANYGGAVDVLPGDPQPFVQSITGTTPAGPTDTAASVTYTVTFSKPVVGVDASNFALALSGVTATTPVVVLPASGPASVYTVTINGILGVGTLGLNLVNDGSIQDSLNTPLGPIGTLQTQQTFATGAGSKPYSITVADVNGDGKPDLIVANNGSNNVGVLLGNGNGTFQTEQTFSTGANSLPNSVAVADLNGDGKPDLIVANSGGSGGNSVGVLLGNGNGTFQAQQTFSTGAASNPFSVAVADVNGDGKPDLIVANFNGNNVGVLLGNGNGTFQAQQTFATGAVSNPISVAVVDVNADGKPDLIVANLNGNNVGVLLGNGNGTFQTEQTFSTGSNSVPNSVAVADVNGDGKPDLIVANFNGNNVGVLLGNGNGTFQAEQTFSTGAGSNPVSVAVADVNGDGKDDIVAVNQGSNSVSVLLGNGSGSFAAPQTSATGSAPQSVAAADVNGDGKDDLVVTNYGSNNVSVLLADPSGNFTGPVYNVAVGADLAIAASGPGTTAAGADSGLTYTLTVTNNGPYANTGFTVTDTLPANTTFVSGSSTAGAMVNGQAITYTNSTGLASGATVTYSIVVTTPLSLATGTTLSDSATVGTTGTLDPNSGNNTSIVTTIVEPEVYFQAQQTFATGVRTYSVTVADVNGDGQPDLIVANKFGFNVGVLLGNGNGTFQAQKTFAVGAFSNPSSVAVADVNVDGKPDLIVANFNGNFVGVLLGNGNGTFQAQQTFSAGLRPFSVAVADLNGDGKPDLIVANSGGNNVSVLLGNGNGTFQAQQTFSTGADPVSVAVADVNGDGKPDLIVANRNTYSVGVLLGNGNGTFQAQKTFSTGIGSYPFSVAVADVNGDGKPDLIVANGFGYAGVLLGNGNGTFQAQQTFSTGGGSNPTSVAVADVNGDGKPDLIVANYGGNNVGVLLGNGNGTFQAQQTFSTGAGSGPFSLAVADVNGDGKPDLVVANYGSGAVSVLLGDPQPFVQSITATTPAGPTDTAASVTYTVTFSTLVAGVAASDFALALGGSVTTTPPLVVSGSHDVYTVTINGISGAGTLGLNLVNNGSIQDSLNTPLGPVGTFQTQQTFAAGAGSSPNSVVSADVNGDGIPDLIVANSAGNNVGVMLGNGNGTFQAEHTFTTGGNSDPYAVTVADVNGDGKADIIVANYNSGNVGILLGNGNGTFQGEMISLVGSGPDSVAVADVNDDGKPDIIVANKGSNYLSVLLGTGSGSFMGQQTFSTGPNSQPTAVAVADVNGDGRLDLVVANYNTGIVGVLLGNGNGTFGSESGFLAGTGPISVAVADVNDDGKPDLIVANKGSNNISVLLGTGSEIFQSQQTFSTGAGSAPRAVTVMDVNNDGKLDLIVADSAGNNVGLLLGNGNGTFATPQTFATGAGSTPVSVAVADVNRDGQLDLLVANKAANNVGVLLADPSGNFTGQVYTIAQTPTLTSSQVGDGSRQRSTLSSATVVFNEPVNFSSASFTLQQSQNDSTFTDVSADVTASNPSSDGMTWVITCNTGSAIDRTGAGKKGFLANGIYQLTLHGSAITDAATGSADYNGGADQIVQFSYNNGASMKNAFAVLFGDVLGTGFVNNSDYLQFKATYGSNNLGTGTYNPALDYDGNGAINNTDYLKFKADYGSSLVFNTEPSDTVAAGVPDNQGIASSTIQSAAIAPIAGNAVMATDDTDAKSVEGGVKDIDALSQPRKARPAGKSLKSYRLSPGTGKNAEGFRFGEKPIA